MYGRFALGILVFGLSAFFFSAAMSLPDLGPPTVDQALKSLEQQKGALRRQIECVIPVYKFRLVQSLIWSNAWFRFSKELATLKRRYPSPKSPKDVPERQATPACSNNASASGFDFQPVF